MSAIVVRPSSPKPIRISYGPGAIIRLVAVPGPSGPQGEDGASGGGNGDGDLSLVASAAIGGHRVVSIDANGRAELALPTVASLLRLAGLTLGAADAGQPITVRRAGAVQEPSWSWTPGGRLFLGSASTLTQQVPASGPLLVLGVALSPTRILLSPQVLIERP